MLVFRLSLFANFYRFEVDTFEVFSVCLEEIIQNKYHARKVENVGQKIKDKNLTKMSEQYGST